MDNQQPVSDKGISAGLLLAKEDPLWPIEVAMSVIAMAIKNVDERPNLILDSCTSIIAVLDEALEALVNDPRSQFGDLGATEQKVLDLGKSPMSELVEGIGVSHRDGKVLPSNRLEAVFLAAYAVQQLIHHMATHVTEGPEGFVAVEAVQSCIMLYVNIGMDGFGLGGDTLWQSFEMMKLELAK